MTNLPNSNTIPAYPVGMAVDPSMRSRPPETVYGEPAKIAFLVHEAILQAGLGKKDPAIPLADVIEPGMTVLMKPNWVLHYNESGRGMECMITHPVFIAAVLEEVLAARPDRVILGDAPVQKCLWDRLVTPEFRERIDRLAARQGVPVEFVDFRRTIVPTGVLADGVRTDVREISRYVLFDLGPDSLLESISNPVGRFRVTDYDPDKLAQTHRPGRHQYLLCREAFEADLVLSMPKLKLHRKAGLTGALKNLVGMNGNKDYLPHHRVGDPRSGGDCYSDRSAAKRLAEAFWDASYRRIGKKGYKTTRFLAAVIRRLATLGQSQHSLEGNWYGNDTCWRMVLDLNRMLYYGCSDGTMSDVPRRPVLSLTDAIVCGEGEGPLKPSPIVVGAVTCSRSAPAAEFVHTALLRLDPGHIALIRESVRQFRWPLSAPMPDGPTVFVGERPLSLEQVIREFGVHASPPAGWVGHIELPVERLA